MVVESTPHLIEEFSHQLAGLGYRVAISRSGTEALEKIRRLQPGVIFLNPLLPALSGWDVLTLLKADEDMQHIPVVVMATRAEREQARQNGADSFLSLPLQAGALQRCLNRLIQTVVAPTVAHLTILHLHDVDRSSIGDLNTLLHPHPCRVLEVDDLEQADLLAQVWKPNVILLDGGFADPLAYVKQIGQSPVLAALPIVTLTLEMTHAANLAPGLAIFPCLASGLAADAHSLLSTSPVPCTLIDRSALWQVLQVAAGISWTPHILIVDVEVMAMAELQANAPEPAPSTPDSPGTESVPLENSTHPLPSPRVRALMNYMQVAGFRSSTAGTWEAVVQQLEHRSVDLLLLCADFSHPPPPFLLNVAQTLAEIELKPAVLVWNYQKVVLDRPPASSIWTAIATEVLPSSLSMQSLLTRINQILTET